MLSVKVVTVDYYIAKPMRELSGSNSRGCWSEPVIRIFGPTPEGVKTCVHVHGIYPYIYVPYRGGDDPDRDARHLAAALNQALAANANNSKTSRYVFKVVLASGLPLYGYHSKPRQFFKIYFTNPYYIRKATELLLSGAILSQRFQPHESHIPFTLQFMIDYNVYGMSFLTLERVRYRRSTGEDSDSLRGVDHHLILPAHVKRNSRSTLEVDVLAEDIVADGPVSDPAASVNPGLRAIWEDERNRRRAQGRSSLITPQVSQPRPETKVTENEAIQRERFLRKLRQVDVESSPSDSLPLSYPAEVPDDRPDILDASIVRPTSPEPGDGDDDLDASQFIDEAIASHVMVDGDNDEEEDNAGGRAVEEDSVLGRNPERDEAESEDDGGDMTQPLEGPEMLESAIPSANRDERGDNSGDDEDDFWRSMADQIMQLDGTDDLSDAKPESVLETDGPEPGWSGNILSILNEPANGSYNNYQTSQQPFWVTPTDLSWSNSDSWSWDRSDSALLDCFAYSAKKGKTAEETYANGEALSSDLYPLPGEYFHGNYTPTSTMSPASNAYNISPPSAILTPSSEVDSYSDVNLDSVCESRISNSPPPLPPPLTSLPQDETTKNADGKPQLMETKTVTLPPRTETNSKSSSPTSASHKDLIDLLKKFSSRTSDSFEDNRVKMVALTLKQYIKTCGEILNVYFKNLSGKEVIVVEYKPANSKSNQNKFLIKPVDKFLEDWTSTEEMLNNAKPGAWPRLINGFATDPGRRAEEEKQVTAILNTLENKYTGNWLDESKIRSIKNRFIVKSIEMLPDGGDGVPRKVVKSDADKSNKTLNEDSASDGKMKMKIVKDGAEDEGDLTRVKSSQQKKKQMQNVADEGDKANEMSYADCGRYKQKKSRNERDNRNADKALIDQINRSFEDYLKNIVKVNTCSSKNEAIAVGEDEESTSGDDPDSETDAEKTSADAIKFITRLLSALSSISCSPAFPPLSITINFGNGRISPSVQFNLGQQRRRRSKKFLVSSLDGPADSDSSDDSLDGKSTSRTSRRSGYRPLNVVVQKKSTTSGSDGASERKRKLPSTRRSLAEELVPSNVSSLPLRSGRSRRRSSDGGTAETQTRISGSKPEYRAGAEEEVEAEDLTRFGDRPGSSQQLPGLDQTPMTESTPDKESDFIADSDEEKEDSVKLSQRKAPNRRRKKKKMTSKTQAVKRPKLDTIPQTDMVSSSSEAMPDDQGVLGFCDNAAMSCGSETHGKDSDVTLSQATPRSHDSQPTSQGSCTPLATGLTDLPLELLSGEIAVNSDDSVERVALDETLRDVTPFDLSGSVLVESGGGSNFLTLRGGATMMPKTKPPSRQRVTETLADFEIPETTAQVPFYGDPSDISKSVEVGERVLKIENYCVAGLKAHRSEVPGLIGTEERRQRALNLRTKEGGVGLRSALVERRDVTIVPLKKPPTRASVISSLKKVKEVGPEVAPVKEQPAARMRVPRSPGQESNDEMDLSVTLTPGSSGRSILENVVNSTPLGSDNKEKRKSLAARLVTITEEGVGDGGEEKKSGSETSFGIRGVSLDNTFGFKNSVECLQNAKAVQIHERVTMLIMELHAETRSNLRPDPQHDAVCAVFLTLVTDAPGVESQTVVVAVTSSNDSLVAPPRLAHLVPDESSLLHKVMELLHEWDPDILAGYEIELLSWGYLFQRGFVLGMNLLSEAGRVLEEEERKWKSGTAVDDSFDDVPRYIRHMKVSGRIVLDVWRLLRHEVALTSYTFENVMYHVLHERHPKHTHRVLTFFWAHPTRFYRHITVDYYVTRTEGIHRLLDHLDFVSRNSELARLFGIQFYEVLSRGSQFRVESMMLRLAKPLNYVPCSPSIRQRAGMRAPASLPLIMEPESKFYADPVIVLDFQSLYPSMIIAYNYCFSTCLGRIEMLGGREPFEFGCTHLKISPEELKTLEKDIHISPAGIAFVRSNIRKGVLPAMLEEILETRLMVKKSMKENKSNKLLQKVLHARQLGLKLIANVTYGYTAANFSGRMPCIEVGDSVVSKGRETLQRAIEMVKKRKEWGARVVYGDTDSLFVLTPGKTREEAFRIGAEIADAVTMDNPKPVKLKLEKVYQPSILQTKKRYVGHMYETLDQEEPVYEAKGIETVRRDGCPATAKILQKALQILFQTRDVSLVKKYTIRQFAKLFQGRVNHQDLVFAREYRGRRGYRPGACVPALQLAKQWTQSDRRAEPRVKERVPYVIVNGPPGIPLIRLVRSPNDLFTDPSLRINAVYYITKAIVPPMQRCFSLIGADVMSWYAEMPRRYWKTAKWTCPSEDARKATISQYFAAVDCPVCSRPANAPICADCHKDKQKVAVVLHDRIRMLERCRDSVSRMCGSCCGRMIHTECDSLDCPVLYRRHQIERDAEQLDCLRDLCEKYLQ